MLGEAVSIDEGVVDEEVAAGEGRFDAEGVNVRGAAFARVIVIEGRKEIHSESAGGEGDGGGEEL